MPTFASSVQRATLSRFSFSWWRLAKHMTAELIPIKVDGAFQRMVDKAHLRYLLLCVQNALTCRGVVAVSTLTLSCPRSSSEWCMIRVRCSILTLMTFVATVASVVAPGPNISCWFVANAVLGRLDWQVIVSRLPLCSAFEKRTLPGFVKSGTVES